MDVSPLIRLLKGWPHHVELRSEQRAPYGGWWAGLKIRVCIVATVYDSNKLIRCRSAKWTSGEDTVDTGNNKTINLLHARSNTIIVLLEDRTTIKGVSLDSFVYPTLYTASHHPYTIWYILLEVYYYTSCIVY